MALDLKQLVQVAQNGASIWSTDQTGEYVVTENEGGWGSPNPELNQSAVMVIGRRDSDPTQYNSFVDAQIKYNASYDNTTVLTWEMDYILDGVHSIYLNRLYASADDIISIEGQTFINNDVWYNYIDKSVKQLVLGVPTILDLTLDEDVDKILATTSVETVLCEHVLVNDLAVKKNDISLELFQGRRDGTCNAEEEKIKNQMDILLSISSANYSFSFGLKQEAQRIIETSLTTYNIV
jgi:hypothetical protein